MGQRDRSTDRNIAQCLPPRGWRAHFHFLLHCVIITYERYIQTDRETDGRTYVMPIAQARHAMLHVFSSISR